MWAVLQYNSWVSLLIKNKKNFSTNFGADESQYISAFNWIWLGAVIAIPVFGIMVNIFIIIKIYIIL